MSLLPKPLTEILSWEEFVIIQPLTMMPLCKIIFLVVDFSIFLDLTKMS